jgi:hypothetical protein
VTLVETLIEHIDRRFDERAAQLDRVEQVLADVGLGVLQLTGNPALASRVVDELIESAYLEERAAA